MILTFSEMGKARRQRLFVLMLIMIRGIGMILRHSVFVMMESNTGMKWSFFSFPGVSGYEEDDQPSFFSVDLVGQDYETYENRNWYDVDLFNEPISATEEEIDSDSVDETDEESEEEETAEQEEASEEESEAEENIAEEEIEEETEEEGETETAEEEVANEEEGKKKTAEEEIAEEEASEAEENIAEEEIEEE